MLHINTNVYLRNFRLPLDARTAVGDKYTSVCALGLFFFGSIGGVGAAETANNRLKLLIIIPLQLYIYESPEHELRSHIRQFSTTFQVQSPSQPRRRSSYSMWLIDTTSLVLKLVDVESLEDHRYVILSHTWEDGEVSFQEIVDLDQARNKPGFSKIDQTCRLARERGIKYAWVDTCCIDKSSSAELTEAINSMYRWYQNSEICFVYLSDFPVVTEKNILSDYLPRCRWFTRGWTLQELIAPLNIQFYDRGWNLRGNKVSLQQPLCQIKGVDTEILEDSDLLPTMSVAKRMSWAAKRHTSRVEDMSYCLFGLFDIHLPLIYGEGRKAFIRLQEAIASENNDLSLFAWTSLPGDNVLRGILANSLSEFRECGSIERNTDPTISRDEFSFTNKGFHIGTHLTYCEGEYQMSLHCFDRRIQEPRGRNASVVIHLIKSHMGMYVSDLIDSHLYRLLH